MSQNYEAIIHKLCKSILVKEDHLDLKGAEDFINQLTGEDISSLNALNPSELKQTIRSFVQKEITNYISLYEPNDPALPFSFDSNNGAGINDYRKAFTDAYKAGYNNAEPPKVFDYAFDCVKEASESYRLFENLFNMRRAEIEERTRQAISSGVELAAKDAADTASTMARESAAAANAQAELAVATAKSAVNDEINKQMSIVSTKVSETSITILSIFAAIVLTTVAGLLYTSSVIANIKVYNFVEQIAGVAMSGLVCFDLIVAMYFFVEKKTPNFEMHLWAKAH